MMTKTINQVFLSNENISNDFEFSASKPWKQKELLAEEFKSLGFYISDHPLNEFEDVFDQLSIRSFNQFNIGSENEGLVAGTIMAIQEKAQKVHLMQLLNLVIKKRNLNYFYFQKF